MAAVKKFLFETRFEAGDGRGPAGGARAARPVYAYTEDDLTSAREGAFDEGKAAGFEQAQASVANRAAEALARIADQLAAADRQLGETIDAIKRDAVEAALTVVRKAMPELSRSHALAEIEALVAGCLDKVLGEPRVVIRAHDAMLDALKERIEPLAERCGYGGKIVLLAEPDMSQSDCRVEWADGGAERDTSRLWEDIDGAVKRFLAVLERQGRCRPAAASPAGRTGADEALPPTPGDAPARSSDFPADGAPENAAVGETETETEAAGPGTVPSQAGETVAAQPAPALDK
jgi:flagellar assembly protein FliH